MGSVASLAAWQAALRDSERLDDLQYAGRRIIQNTETTCFSLDAVLLARFACIKRGDHVLELGTGAGVIPLLIARDDLTIDAVEIDPVMAELAMRNVRLNGLADCVRVRTGDFRATEGLGKRGSFDCVLSNPPWYPLGQGKIGRAARAHHEITATLADVAAAARHALRFGGRFALVHVPARLDELFFALKENGMAVRRLQFFAPRMDAAPRFVLVEAVVGASVGALTVLPPLLGDAAQAEKEA
ncbi:tRNA1(Val) (adenine(37)-N6)-methyltransferase [Selenomonas sp.]|uniref:tRNA1(Val) (adenine(37)-N6)-methyltransferase n=1 Tax=Selenomonas sp. TaxID=2053611 RepID=UPI003FA2AD54